MRKTLAMTAVLFLAGAACQQPSHGENRDDRPVPLFKGMGDHQRAITTKSLEARTYFNQGLNWAFAFNHDEAIRSFQEAARLDPTCAMAYWGIALCNGPHINNPKMSPEQSRAAWEAIQKALSLRAEASYLEAKLIEALSARYAQKPPDDRTKLDEAYAHAMAKVYELDINDADIGTLYAESLMDLQPWDLWTHDKRPKGQATKIIALLQHALKIDPNHPGANHLLIHAVEASAHPEQADGAATVLRTLVPASGHLVHMPSHIDIRMGRWAIAEDQNVAAIKVDAAYRKLSPKQGFYSVYMAHNHQFLAFAAMMEGRSEVALKAAKAMIADVPPEFLRDQPQFIDPFMMIVLDALKRFGRWDDILREPPPAKNLPITLAMYHFTRGLAFAAKDQIDDAAKEQQRFKESAEKVPQDALMAINPAHKVLSIAEHMLAGEIAFRRKNIDEAVKELRAGVELEDSLLYMEPPEWMQPVRHTLGAVLVSAKRYDEAEKVYREDLKFWPENAWSLFGLAQCLRAQNRTAELSGVEKQFEKAWSRADVKIGTSCLCVPGK